MALIDLPLPPADGRVPGDVRAFLRDADRRIRRFQRRQHVPGFVAGDYARAYGVLRAVADVAPGALFCEWGSGFGVVTCLAAMLEFDACGIEVEADLVDAARRLADDYELPAEFAAGSYLPRGAAAHTADRAFGWLATDADDAHADLGLAPADFGVIFAYPWPDEEALTTELFERYAGPDALLLSHHGGEEFRLRRKGNTQ